MAGKKGWFFKKLRKESWGLKFLGSALKRKRLNLPVSFMKDVIFKAVSVFEAIVLVMNLAFFYLCCGCSF